MSHSGATDSSLDSQTRGSEAGDRPGGPRARELSPADNGDAVQAAMAFPA